MQASALGVTTVGGAGRVSYVGRMPTAVLSVPGHVGGGLGWRGLSRSPPQAREEPAQWRALRRLSGFI